MGDVISSHLDEGKREIITARTGEVMGEFARLYEQQYGVALFNKMRFDIEGGGSPQPQLLHRKIPLENRSIFSGALFQYLEENRKWRNRFLFIPDSYNISYYDSKASHDRGLHPKGTINCAGYKVLTSMDQYLELVSGSLPGVNAKVGNSPFLKCATQFPLILWHPYARHCCFCVVTEKEQQKWLAVFQDCVRHANDGLSEESKVQTPAFTDSVRLYRQGKGLYGTWDMMCGVPSQILSNLVMEGLLPDLRELISPRLKGKMHERQRNWMLISDAVYSLVQRQCRAQFEAVVQRCEAGRPALEASIRTDMDQVITSKEHVTNKIRGVVLPKAEKLLKVSIQPYIGSILEALMEPTSRGFAEVRDVFFRELVDMSKNSLNQGTKETVAEHMEKISMLAFHPVKMQSCYEKVEPLSLEGLQQRFDVSSPSVFVQRAQILMREQMDDAVYTFEQILHQCLESQGTEGLCKTIQRCQDRVIKKFDYDSSTVRKRFFREALLQIFIPYMLKQLTPACASDLPAFQELIFEDFSRFILVENIFEEVVLHSVMKDIMMAVKEAAVQRRHNLYRDSIVLTSSDPNLHLLGDNPPIDWAGEYGGTPPGEEPADGEDVGAEGAESQKRRRMKQVVSMIQVEGSPVLPNESCLEVPGVDGIPEEGEEERQAEEKDVEEDGRASTENQPDLSTNSTASPSTPESPPCLTSSSPSKEGTMASWQEQTKASPEEQSKDGPEEQSKDGPEEQSKDSPEEQSKDSPEEQSKDSPEEQSKDSPEEQSKDGPEEQSKDSPEEQSKDGPEEQSKDSPEEQSKDSPEEQSKDSPEEQSKDSPEEQSKDSPEEQSKDGPEEQSKDSPEEQSKDSPEEQSDASLQEQSKDSLEEQSDASLQEQSKDSLEEQSDASPQEQSEDSREEQSDASPQEESKDSPEEQSDASPQEQSGEGGSCPAVQDLEPLTTSAGSPSKESRSRTDVQNASQALDEEKDEGPSEEPPSTHEEALVSSEEQLPLPPPPPPPTATEYPEDPCQATVPTIAPVTDSELTPADFPPPPPLHDDSGFQSPTSEEEEAVTAGGEDAKAAQVREDHLSPRQQPELEPTKASDSQSGEEDTKIRSH